MLERRSWLSQQPAEFELPSANGAFIPIFTFLHKWAWICWIPQNFRKGLRLGGGFRNALPGNHGCRFAHIKNILDEMARRQKSQWRTSQLENWVAGILVSQPVMAVGKSGNTSTKIVPLSKITWQVLFYIMDTLSMREGRYGSNKICSDNLWQGTGRITSLELAQMEHL